MLIFLDLIDSPEKVRKLEHIYISYNKTMYYAAYRILKNTFSAEDAVHEAFLRIIYNLEKIEDISCLKTRGFVVAIVENIAKDIYRKNKRENFLSYDELELFITEKKFEFCITNDITDAILQLPTQFYVIFELKYIQGYNNQEISKILGISVDAVYKRIYRGKSKLFKILNNEV